MDWDKLRVFHAVAEAGSFTHAGESLNLSQSAVSRQISALEEEINTPLFQRHARGLTLTDDGSNPKSWAKDGGYLNTPGYSSTGTAPTTVNYYYNLTNNTVFPANYNTTNKVFKVTALWTTLTAGQTSQFSFSAVQF